MMDRVKERRDCMTIGTLLEERKLPPLLPVNHAEGMSPARRQEIIELLSREEYGFLPDPPAEIRTELLHAEPCDFAGKACHTRARLGFDTPGGPFSFPVDFVVPYSDEKPPLIIYISFTPYDNGRYKPVEEIIDSGFAFATFCYEDITADSADGFSSGLAALYPRHGGKTDWGKISMWAWAASRALDYALTISEIDPDRIFCVGHSRLGKTALWCAGTDTRFAGAYANNSGCSGAALSRGKMGEKIENITRVFPFWFCERYAAYAGREEEAAFDQHFLLALLAPRLLYVASAAGDAWADPASEFLCCAAASPAWERSGMNGFVCGPSLPETGAFFPQGRIGYHLRSGTHYHSRYDWNRFMEFAKMHG